MTVHAAVAVAVAAHEVGGTWKVMLVLGYFAACEDALVGQSLVLGDQKQTLLVGAFTLRLIGQG